MRVLFENNDVVVVDKPSGVAVHPGSGIVMEETVAGELLQQYPGLPVSNGEDRPGIVHRLDKDTSGVLLVARTEEALKFYIDAWKGRRVEKVYTVLVAGLLVPETGTIEAPITRDPVHRQKMTAMKNSPKIAVTHYKVMRILLLIVLLLWCASFSRQEEPIRFACILELLDSRLLATMCMGIGGSIWCFAVRLICVGSFSMPVNSNFHLWV
jgi:hypothetical protein